MAGIVVDERDGRASWGAGNVAVLFGLPIALLVVAGGTIYGISRIQNDLNDRTETALGTVGIDPGSMNIDVDYRDVAISGPLPAGVSAEQVSSAIDQNVDDLRNLEVDAGADLDDPESTAEPAAANSTTTSEPSTSAPETTEPVAASTTTSAPTTVDEAPPISTSTDEEEDGNDDEEEVDDEVARQVGELQRELDALADEIAETIVFSSSSDDLTNDARVTLDAVVALMDEYPLAVVRVTGHTDNRGNADTNESLSASRAESVTNQLVREGISRARTEWVGAGESEPIADNSTLDGQRENRRVEFTALEAFT